MWFMEHFLFERLISEMDAYLYHAQYASSFDDIVTYILVNALTINIIVVSQTALDYGIIAIQSENKCLNDDFITVYRCGTHYDAMMIMHGISSEGIGSENGDHTFTGDSSYLQHAYISDIYNLQLKNTR